MIQIRQRSPHQLLNPYIQIPEARYSIIDALAIGEKQWFWMIDGERSIKA
jgi:hypothetical protein